jgi:hypothetical protein
VYVGLGGEDAWSRGGWGGGEGAKRRDGGKVWTRGERGAGRRLTRRSGDEGIVNGRRGRGHVGVDALLSFLIE